MAEGVHRGLKSDRYTEDQIEAALKKLLREGKIEVFMKNGEEHYRYIPEGKRR